MFSIVSARLLRFVLVPSLALWIAGTGCLIGCNRNVVAATSTGAGHHDANTVVAADACATQKAHDCCAKTRRRTASKQAEANNNTAIDFLTSTRGTTGVLGCPLAANRALVLANPGSIQPPGVVSIAFATDPRNDPTVSIFSQTEYLIPPNRGHTYLRCCVFLI